MATLFSLVPTSSSSLVFSHGTCKQFASYKTKPNFKFKKPVSVGSVLSLATDPQIPESVQTFWQWLCDEGVVSSKTPVRPGVVPEGLGLVATKDIGKGEVVLEVPRRFWINPDAVAASEIGGVCSGLKPWISVTLFLLRERSKEDSKWKHYIDILPESTDSTIYWSEEELAEIEGSSLLSFYNQGLRMNYGFLFHSSCSFFYLYYNYYIYLKFRWYSELPGTQLLSTTLGVKDYVEKEFLKVEEEVILRNKKLFSFPITLDDFFWAFGILRSRAFSGLRNQKLVVIPFADLVRSSAPLS